MTSRDFAAGVTLVEMLVALVLFALVGIASFATLDTIIRVRDRTEGRLELIAQYDRTMQLFTRDVMQMVPVDFGSGSETLALVHPSAVQLDWVLEDDLLVRRAVVDAARDAIAQTLLSDVTGLRFRFLDGTMNWSDIWPPDDEDAMLRAVEMQIDLGGDRGVLTRLAEVPLPVPDMTPPLDFMSGTLAEPNAVPTQSDTVQTFTVEGDATAGGTDPATVEDR